jgi:hypothetical protein
MFVPLDSFIISLLSQESEDIVEAYVGIFSMQTQLDMEIFARETPLTILNSHEIASFLISSFWGKDQVEKMIHILTERFELAPLEMKKSFLLKKELILESSSRMTRQQQPHHVAMPMDPHSPRVSII